MKLSDILEEIQNDSNLDKARLDDEAINIPFLHGKYFRMWSDEIKALRAYEYEYNILKKKRRDYYLGLAQDEDYKNEPLDHVVIKADLDLYLQSDDELSKLLSKKEIQQHKAEIIEHFIKTLNNRSFIIKNAIDFQKFQNGVM